jgi:hypothetical protein
MSHHEEARPLKECYYVALSCVCTNKKVSILSLISSNL